SARAGATNAVRASPAIASAIRKELWGARTPMAASCVESIERFERSKGTTTVQVHIVCHRGPRRSSAQVNGFAQEVEQPARPGPGIDGTRSVNTARGRALAGEIVTSPGCADRGGRWRVTTRAQNIM